MRHLDVVAGGARLIAGDGLTSALRGGRGFESPRGFCRVAQNGPGACEILGDIRNGERRPRRLPVLLPTLSWEKKDWWS